MSTNMSKPNNTKTNTTTLLTLTEIENVLKPFSSANIKLYTDNVHYVGIGKSKNSFSVNVTKTQYNIYTDYVLTEKIDGVTFTKNGNSADKVRPHKIVCRSTDALKKLIEKRFTVATAK